MRTRLLRAWSVGGLAWAAALLLVVGPVWSQQGAAAGEGAGEAGGFQLQPALLGDFGLADGPQEPEIQLSAEYLLLGRTGDARYAQVQVQAKLAAGWHVYSMTQAAGGPTRSELRVVSPAGASLVGVPQPDAPPHERFDELIEAWKDIPIQEHEGQVTWTALVRLPAEFDGSQPLELSFFGQVCKDSCLPVDEQLVATPRDTLATAGHATWSGRLTSAQVQPGGTVTVELTAVSEPGWHVYEYRTKDPSPKEEKLNYKPTLLTAFLGQDWRAAAAVPSQPPIVKEEAGTRLVYHEGTVTWTLQLTLPEQLPAGPQLIEGLIGSQTCNDGQCDTPAGLRFSGVVEVGGKASGEVPLVLTAADYGAAAKLAAAAGVAPAPAPSGWTSYATTGELLDSYSLGTIFGYALLGGFILNFMPCVLPVIGLKIMSFVHQSGKSHTKAFMLNVWYSLGVIAVFLILATLVVVFGVVWGEWNQRPEFAITMACVMFVMGLSLLGVWEIPIPGFIGSGRAGDMAQQEGAVGAVMKGVITTLLAVPCAGPGFATAVVWCAGKPTAQVYLVFTAIGLGMSLPYLVIGANPKLIRFIPKPGEWMVVFQQVMGFFLLGAVVYIMSWLPGQYFIPTLALLFALWAGCWWIDRIPVTASLHQVLRNWALASGFAALVGIVIFSVMLGESKHALDWQPFSIAKLDEELKLKKTVMVDFTADWCPTCKVLEATVLNTRKVKSLVERNQIVPMVADYTERSPEITRVLTQFRAKAIPVLIIFPAGGNEPIVLRDGYTQATLLKLLEEAGPSASGPDLASASDPASTPVRR